MPSILVLGNGFDLRESFARRPTPSRPSMLPPERWRVMAPCLPVALLSPLRSLDCMAKSRLSIGLSVPRFTRPARRLSKDTEVIYRITFHHLITVMAANVGGSGDARNRRTRAFHFHQPLPPESETCSSSSRFPASPTDRQHRYEWQRSPPRRSPITLSLDESFFTGSHRHLMRSTRGNPRRLHLSSLKPGTSSSSSSQLSQTRHILFISSQTRHILFTSSHLSQTRQILFIFISALSNQAQSDRCPHCSASRQYPKKTYPRNLQLLVS